MASPSAPLSPTSTASTTAAHRYGSSFVHRFTSILRPASLSITSPLRVFGSHDSAVHEKDFAHGSNDTTPSSDLEKLNEKDLRPEFDFDGAIADNKDRRRATRTLPPWVHPYDSKDVQLDPSQASHLLPQSPASAATPQHNYMPAPKSKAVRGRAYDHIRVADPVTPSGTLVEKTSRWQAFAESSAYGWSRDEERHIADEEWVKENAPDLSEPWDPGNLYPKVEKDNTLWLFSGKKRIATRDHFQRVLMRNPFVPLIIRVFVMAFTSTALGLGARIYVESALLNQSPAAKNGTDDTGNNPDYICQQQASTYLAFIVDTVAILYLFYITWDEYFSKPLGLRSSKAKMRLLFLDLLFIAFSAANLSLAFNTLTDQQWSCYHGNNDPTNSNNQEAATTTCIYNESLCHRQRALCGVLVVAEVAWLLTFCVSTLRVVERLSR